MLGLGALAAALAAAIWPMTTALVAVVAATVLLAWRHPVLALPLALLLFGFEGSVKLVLGLESSPLPGSNRAAGAAALDVALFAAVAGSVFADRLRAPRTLWAGAGRLERAVVIALLAWLAVSVLQVAQGGELQRGLEGFRLFQAYTLVALAALALLWRRERAPEAIDAAIAVGGIVALYAAFRVVAGPTDEERMFALSLATTTTYGDAVRAIGSFTSAVAMVSYLTPVALFGLVAGYLAPRVRVAAWAVAALALVGILGSYGRAPLAAIAVGLVFAAVVLVMAPSVPRRRKRMTAVLAVVAIACTYGGFHVASLANDDLRERARGVLNPFDDESANLRVDTWEDAISDAGEKPLGRGLGAAGAASDQGGKRLVTTDNSYLKVLVEQGIPVAALFVLGLLGVVGLAAARLRMAAGERRALGVAALSAFVGFLVLSISGEYVEQPGKVVAWACLGAALAMAFAPAREHGEEA